MNANTVVESCASTNDLAKRLGEEGAPHGTWISARVQTSGRGRLGRQWQSEPGNLFVSIVLRVEPRAVWTWIPMAAAVGVATFLRTRSRLACVKWPNDLWILSPNSGVQAGAKVGGILGEAVGNRTGSFLVLGIGLNCAHAPEGLDQPTASLDLDVDEIRPRIVEAIVAAVDDLARSGPNQTVAGYQEVAAIAPGTLIEWGESGVGVVQGLGESGELLVKSARNEIQHLFAEDVKIRLSSRPGVRS